MDDRAAQTSIRLKTQSGKYIATHSMGLVGSSIDPYLRVSDQGLEAPHTLFTAQSVTSQEIRLAGWDERQKYRYYVTWRPWAAERPELKLLTAMGCVRECVFFWTRLGDKVVLQLRNVGWINTDGIAVYANARSIHEAEPFTVEGPLPD
jgi:hypothetical protein